jgi:pimeloyl-ACP methyl ester carboxylesterase
MMSNRIPMSLGQASKKSIPDHLADSWFERPFGDRRIMRDAAGFLAGMNSRLTLDAAERLRDFPRPALVAWSAEDKFFPVSDGEKLASLMPEGRLVLIEDSYTFSPIDQPEATAGEIVSFLEETGQGAGSVRSPS